MSAPSGMVIGAAPSGRPREAERWTGPGLWLALGVHGLLLLALAFSMNWKMSDPAPVEAEVWSAIPRVAGGAAPPPPPPVLREPPVVRPAPAPVKAVDPEPEPQRPPDLVIAKTPPKKVEPRKPEPKPEPKPDPKPKREEPKREAPKPEVVKKPEPQKPEPRKDVPKPATVAKPSKATDPQSRSQTAAELEAQRQANLQRMMSSLGGGSGGPGAAARSSGPSAGYAGRIIARVKPNIVFAENLSGNPQAVVEVRCAPDGRIMSRRLVSSSGAPAWDEAVLRALERTEVLPADVDGRVPPLMQLSFKPRDF